MFGTMWKLSVNKAKSIPTIKETAADRIAISSIWWPWRL